MKSRLVNRTLQRMRAAGKHGADLVRCPDCGRSGFTPRGLVAHRGSRHCQRTKGGAL